MSEENAALNTDIELFREIPGDYHAPSLHVTTNGGIGINVGGSVIVKPLREWHKQASRLEHLEAGIKEIRGKIKTVIAVYGNYGHIKEITDRCDALLASNLASGEVENRG